MSVPLLDLTRQYQSLADELQSAMREVVEEQRFILGPVVERFEGEVAEYLGVEHAVGCASGTDALLLSLRALDVAPGRRGGDDARSPSSPPRARSTTWARGRSSRTSARTPSTSTRRRRRRW